MKLRIAVLAFLLCGPLHAAVDCAKTSLAAGEELSAYLLDYGKACVADPAASQLREWQIAPSEHDLSKMVPAWHDVSERFRALSARTPQSALSRAYAALAERAKSAGNALKSSLEARNLNQQALYANAAWQLPESTDPSDLFFRAVAGHPALIIHRTADQDCADKASAVCRSALADGKALMLNWRLADRLSFPVSSAAIEGIAKVVEAKKALWNKYLYDSKPMLPLDFIATDFMDGRWKKSDQYPDGFREPPDTQWFLLHPAVAVEQLGSAPDGEELKPVLVLEVLGVNRWRDERRWFKDVPGLRALSGASLAVTYADRAGVRDTGVGLLFTFSNVYSLGLVQYESKTALLFSLDLASLFREKYKEKYDSFKRDVKNTLF